jgi:hypothetical protein
LLRARPGHTLRARGVIQMNVRVDNGDGISLGIGACYAGGDRNRPCGSRLYEFASIHFGFLLCAILSASGLESRLRPYYLVPNRREAANRTKCRIWPAQPLLARTALTTSNSPSQDVPGQMKGIWGVAVGNEPASHPGNRAYFKLTPMPRRRGSPRALLLLTTTSAPTVFASALPSRPRSAPSNP